MSACADGETLFGIDKASGYQVLNMISEFNRK